MYQNVYYCNKCKERFETNHISNSCPKCTNRRIKFVKYYEYVKPEPEPEVEVENDMQYFVCFHCGRNIATRLKTSMCPKCGGRKLFNLDNPPKGFISNWKTYYKCFDCLKLHRFVDISWEMLLARRKMVGDFYKCPECGGLCGLLYDWYEHLEQRENKELDEFYRKIEERRNVGIE